MKFTSYFIHKVIVTMDYCQTPFTDFFNQPFHNIPENSKPCDHEYKQAKLEYVSDESLDGHRQWNFEWTNRLNEAIPFFQQSTFFIMRICGNKLCGDSHIPNVCVYKSFYDHEYIVDENNRQKSMNCYFIINTHKLTTQRLLHNIKFKIHSISVEGYDAENVITWL